MSCNKPLEAYRTPAGEVKIGVCPADCRWMELPCGRCYGCKADRARAWTLRIMHEAQLYDSNRVVTLTYAPEFLPWNQSLYYGDYQGFMKRLRKRVKGADGSHPIRFFVAGEYGEDTRRPHFHAILFNTKFKDEQVMHNKKLASALCEDLWKRGNVVIDFLTAASAAYVAQYVNKKVFGSGAEDHYEDIVDMRTGELLRRRPEFVQMSRRFGIGSEWYEKFESDLFPVDHAVMNGQRYKVPRYYVEKYRVHGDPVKLEVMMESRYMRAAEQKAKGESTPERRAVREEVAQRKADAYGKRGL